jgi:hypothetical protein
MRLMRPLDGATSMLELGNKTGRRGRSYKGYFEALGVRHVSVDLNGKDGALALDLRTPLGLGRFDVVTNIGTTEHVTEQEPAWRNIAESCDRLFLSMTPRPGSYRGHGLFYPTPAFYWTFAVLNGFEIERLYEDGRPGKRVLMVRMRRVGEMDFTMPEETLLFREGDSDPYTRRT